MYPVGERTEGAEVGKGTVGGGAVIACSFISIEVVFATLFRIVASVCRRKSRWYLTCPRDDTRQGSRAGSNLDNGLDKILAVALDVIVEVFNRAVTFLVLWIWGMEWSLETVDVEVDVGLLRIRSWWSLGLL